MAGRGGGNCAGLLPLPNDRYPGAKPEMVVRSHRNSWLSDPQTMPRVDGQMYGHPAAE